MRGEVVKVLQVLYNKYFKCWQVRFRAKCPRCSSINKHGETFRIFPEKVHIKGTRACDRCGLDYEYEWSQVNEDPV